MTVRYYSSGDAGAPALPGNTPGALIDLLDKCLVTGYGSKPGAGWTKAFSGTNIAAFKQGAGSNGMYLRVDDSAVLASNATRFARMRGYEQMTDINTGTNQFPLATDTAALGNTGGSTVLIKANSSNAANARPWIVVADERLFYLFIQSYQEYGNPFYYNGFHAFGDIVNLKPVDPYATILIGYGSGDSLAQSSVIFNLGNSIASVPSNHYNLARAISGVGAPIRAGMTGDYSKQGGGTPCNGIMTYPNPADGALYMGQIQVSDAIGSTQAMRGLMPGLWTHFHPPSIMQPFDTFDGQGPLAGKSFQILPVGSNASVIVETSDTWR